MLVTNPLNHPFFWVAMVNMLGLLLVGACLVVFVNRRRLRATFSSRIWRASLAWVAMIPPFFISVFSGGLASIFLISGIAILSLGDFCRILSLPRFFFRVMLVNTAISFVCAIFNPDLVSALPYAYFLVVVLAAHWWSKRENLLPRITFTLYASIWISFALVHFLLMARLPHGLENLVVLGFSIASADLVAVFVSSVIPRTEQGIVSVFANILGACLGSAAFLFSFPDLTVERWFVLSVIIGLSVWVSGRIHLLFRRFILMMETIDPMAWEGRYLNRIAKLLVAPVLVYYYLTLHL